MGISRAYSQDSWDQVIDATLIDKHSPSVTAARFGVATTIVWVRRARETGAHAAKRRVSQEARSLMIITR